MAGLARLESAPDPRPSGRPPAAAWLFRDVAPDLTRTFEVPATIDNECNLAALGALAFGAARGRRHVIYLKLVTGMGAGLIVNGQLVRGANGLAGELSHLHVDSAGPMCRCGARGCLGVVATTDHVLEAARPLFGPDVNIYDILGLAAQGEATVRRVLDDFGRLVGRHLAPPASCSTPS
ncbi:ROK family protein [Streptomyces sp. FXJ1.4098]|nr:ROK family protein [Streptomyces sp. FXJ1.4098]